MNKIVWVICGVAVILVQGYRAKNGKPIANGAKVTFANGRDFFLGSSSEPGQQ